MYYTGGLRIDEGTRALMIVEDMKKKTLTFVNKSPNKDPEYTAEGNSGFDLRAWIRPEDEDSFPHYNGPTINVNPLERKMIHTGLYFDIPYNTEIQVRPRSGMAYKEGLTVINSPGTVDSNYTGECCVLVINLSNKPVSITNGDRIAQAVLVPVFDGGNVKLEKVEELKKETERGENGFGSSGIK